MGAVYEALRLSDGHLVAVKMLGAQHAAKPDAVRRFWREAHVTGSIGHPNLCEIFDIGTFEATTPYLVMQRLFGESLAQRIEREGGLDFDDVVEIVSQVLEALRAAHERGVIHRDVKPANVFLTSGVGGDPGVKLLDFGLSKAPESDAELHLTSTGVVMGTPFYMAPEQARGEAVDSRVDLYAAGVVLYECLTGQRPFAASNYNALLLQILSSTPPAIDALRPATPAAFVPVVLRALERRTDLRFSTADEFLTAMHGVRASLHTAASLTTRAPVEHARRVDQQTLVGQWNLSDDPSRPPTLRPLPPEPSSSVTLVDDLGSELAASLHHLDIETTSVIDDAPSPAPGVTASPPPGACGGAGEHDGAGGFDDDEPTSIYERGEGEGVARAPSRAPERS